MPGENTLIFPDVSRPVMNTGLPQADNRDVVEVGPGSGNGNVQIPLAAIIVAAVAYLWVMRRSGFKGLIVSG